MTEATNDDRRHIAQLMSNAKVAMLTTTSAEGEQVSRPMGLREAEFDGDLGFFAYDGSAKVTRIKTTPEVNVSFSDTKNGSWTSIAGRAEPSTTAQL